MKSPFTVNQKTLLLQRLPVKQINRSLQAWDSADEYLITHFRQLKLAQQPLRIVVFNDSFGALTCNLTEHTVFCVNDSYISQQGIEHNLTLNNLSNSNTSLLNSLDSLPENIDVILFKIPKSNSLLRYQLTQIRQRYTESTIVIAANRAKEIHKSTLSLFEQYLGTTSTSLAVKKARLVFSQLNNKHPDKTESIVSWPLENSTYTLSNHANVYAREQLDIGARYFLQNLPDITAQQKVIDLGCGNGVIGLKVLSIQPQAHLNFVDESYMAIASAKLNIENNLNHLSSQCQFHINDCLTNFANNSVDLILCNPPFHQQYATTDHIAWQMFKDSYRVLKKGGELRIIGNRQLGYHIKLKRIFGNEKLIASNAKFVTISAIKN